MLAGNSLEKYRSYRKRKNINKGVTARVEGLYFTEGYLELERGYPGEKLNPSARSVIKYKKNKDEALRKI